MKLNIFKLWNEKNQLVSIKLLYNKIKSCRKKEVYYMHNHKLEYLNIIKVNSKLKNPIKIEVAKAYQPIDINKNSKRVKLVGNKAKLEDAGGVYLNLKEIHNLNTLQKLNNLNYYIIRARIK